MIDYGKFRLSLKRLEQQNETYHQGNPALSDLVREGIAESFTQRFKTCHDCLWRLLKRYLTEALGIAETLNSPQPVFRLAYQNDRLAAPPEQWLRYADACFDASHNYDGEKAKACLVLVPDLIDDAIGLYQTMSGAVWE